MAQIGAWNQRMTQMRKNNDSLDIIVIGLQDDGRELVLTCAATNTARYFVHAKPQRFGQDVFKDCQRDEAAAVAILTKMGYQESPITPAVVARLVYVFRWHTLW